MALVLADRVRETTTVTGTGTATLLGAAPGYQSFSAVGNANTTYYVIANQSATEWEVGIGTYTASGTLLSRDTVLASSNSGSLVNFSAGTKDVFVDYPAGRAVYEDAAGNVDGYPITGGTINNTTIGATTPSTGVFTTLTAQNETLVGTGQNLLLQSQTFNNASWSKSNTTITAGSITAPDGTATGQTFTSAGSGPTYFVTQNTTVATLTQTFSIYLKAGTLTSVQLYCYAASAGANTYTATFNISAGTVTSSSATGTGTLASATITSVGDGWFRCVLAGNVNQSGALGTVIYTGNGNFYAWGSQLELGSTANTYIPTTTTAVYGTPTLSFSGVASIGLQSDGSLYETSAGTGNVRFYTNNIAQEQARVSHTASAVNFVNLTGGATANDAQISALGSDTNIWLQLNGKGSRGVAIGYFTRIGKNFANYFEATGNNASSAPILSVGGSDTNIDLNLTTKGTGAVNLNTGGGTQVQVSNTASAVNYVELTGGPLNNAPTIGAKGSNTNISFAYSSKGTGGHDFYTSGTSFTQQVKISHTASAVNYVQVTGAATGFAVNLSAQGSDTNIQIQLQAKGTGLVRFTTGGGLQAYVSDTVSAVNQLNFTGAVTGFGPRISAQGSDTNIPLVLQPKGTGALQAQQTDSTATGGNARGVNAVDWQTLRGSASSVASGAYSVVGGGYNNSTNGVASAITGGYSNIITTNGYAGFVGGGQANQTQAQNSAVVGGYANLATGFFNFVGGGSNNSTTAQAPVTTQSATMNGTTAVTLSGSNANIKVGQLITGTNIATFSYVAAVSGTSLTLSQAASGSSTSTLSFYTPHGVVVGGGNNQATGSYSFIGGGGNAGTAGGRNVASGDWSVVSGGQGNQATGVASTVGGGGFDGTNTIGNVATTTGATVVGGAANTASGVYAVTGGRDNIADGNRSTAWGSNAWTRGIRGIIALSACQSPIGGVGVSQSSLLIIGKQTTDATATVLTSNGGAASSDNQLIMPNNAAYAFRGTVIANVTGGGNTKAWAIEGAIKRGANAASTALVGTPTVTSGFADAGASTWAIAVTADTTNGGLAITFTGQASTTIRCVAKLETTEVTF